jgi:hypothetical protein
MRHLFALGLTLSVVWPAAAQTEIIIRRPGEKDQVIRLDSARTREALAKAKVQLQTATGALQQRVQELQGKVSELRLNEEPLRLNTLALRNGELAAEGLVAPLMKSFAAILRQPHLGILVATTPRETDKYGAYVSAVTPGSPAEKAGIMSGDIITKIAGKSLTEKDPKDDSGPGVRLVSIIGTLTVGKPVDVELRRGTQNKTVKVTPDDGDAGAIAQAELGVRLPLALDLNRALTLRTRQPWNTDPQPFNVFSNGNGGAFSFSFGNNGLFASYELAPLNEKLGAYFGTSEGVLVVTNRSIQGFEEASIAMPRDVVMGRMQTDSLRAMPRQMDSVRATPRAGGVVMGRPVTRVDTIRVPGRPDSIRTRTIVRGSRVDENPTFIDGVQVRPGAYSARKPVNIGLEPGDVIVSVDGRKVSNPGQLMRIVGSYEHNDEFKLQIMRQKHAETLTVKMP